MSELVALDAKDGIARITLMRPDRGNALSLDMTYALQDAVQTAVDGGARVLAFSGGGRHFCSGFDLSDLDDQSDGDLLLRFVAVEEMLQSIMRVPAVTVGFASGAATGAGADLFVACDHRMCTKDARFSFPGIGFGLILGTRRLVEVAGRDALNVVTGRRTLNAEQAHAMGIASAVIEPASFEKRLAEIAPADFDAIVVPVLRQAASRGTQDADLAALVRSASRPGLQDRIRAYRDRTTRRVDAPRPRIPISEGTTDNV